MITKSNKGKDLKKTNIMVNKSTEVNTSLLEALKTLIITFDNGKNNQGAIKYAKGVIKKAKL